MGSQDTEQVIVPPTSIEGIAIHIGYLRRDIQEVGGKMDSLTKNTVGRDEFRELLKDVSELKTFRDNFQGAKDEARKNARFTGGVSGAVVGTLATALLALINFIVHK